MLKKRTLPWYQSPYLYAFIVMLGILNGYSGIPLFIQIGTVLSDVFIRIFQCISLPIILLSLIVTLATYQANVGMGQVWQRTLRYTLGTTLVAACTAAVLFWLIHPQNVGSVAAVSAVPVDNHADSYWQHVSHLIPDNIFSPFLDHQVLSVLLIGILVGLGVRSIEDEAARTTLTNFFKGAHALFLTITRWVIAIIPLGLFGFITTTIVQLRGGMELKGLGQYLAIIVLANVVQGAMVLPSWLLINGINPWRAFKGMLPALSVAFFSKSSAGTLPVTMETMETNLGVDRKVSRFVLPLCTSINMNGCAAFIFTTVIYLLQNHGVDISFGTMALWVLVATIAAIGNAGVPMGCFFLSASLLASMNVPITLLGIILPFYSVIDMIETALNVWSDSCVAIVVDEKVAMPALVSEREGFEPSIRY